MRVLVYPHELAMGGSQLNAIELAGAVRDRGHEVTVFATGGVLESKIHELGLDFVQAPPRRRAIDPAVARSLGDTVRARRIDVIHPYEWPACVETAFGPGRTGTPATVMTVLSMDVPDFLPGHLPIIVGTRRLAELAARPGRRVHLIEPPIDTRHNSPGSPGAARRELGLPESATVISVVGRLSEEHEKYRGVLAAIEVVERLARTGHGHPVILFVAGDGEGMPAVAAAADRANARLGSRLVRVLGNVADPRPYYDAADVVLGMGGSALRAMAFAKPLVVQGAAGFWRLSSPESQGDFLTDGWFGRGGHGADELEAILRPLLETPEDRDALGGFGRSLVESRFGLDRAADRLVEIYRTTVRERAESSARRRALLRSGVEVAKFRSVLALQRAGLRQRDRAVAS